MKYIFVINGLCLAIFLVSWIFEFHLQRTPAFVGPEMMVVSEKLFIFTSSVLALHPALSQIYMERF